MKKNIILCAAVLLVGIAIFTSIKMTSPSESSIAENVEALAWGEGDCYDDCFVIRTYPTEEYTTFVTIRACKDCEYVDVVQCSLKGFCVK